MLTLNDGRTELWQWDTGRKLTVDADCSQVHFSNKVFGRSIDVDVVDGVAIIPDILLQTEKELTAWAFVGTAENGYTKISKAFKVNKRNKPADYVFTVPDQTTLGEILDRIDNLENRPSGDVSEEDIQDAVSDYLDKNPVLFEEKDPTVPEWAKRPEKPVYTADEVGALRQGELQTGIDSALEQAKTSGVFNGKDGRDGEDGKDGADGKSAYQYAQDAGYGGTEEEFAQKLAEDAPSGGSKEWRLLHNVELTEEVAANAGMEFDTTGCKEIIVRWICPKISNKTGFAMFKINGEPTDNGGPFWNNKLCSTTATTDRSFRFEALGDSVVLSPLWIDGDTHAAWWNGEGMFNTIDTLQLVHYGGTYPIGLKIIIWGW